MPEPNKVGPGRPPLGNVPLSLKIRPDIEERVRKEAEEQGRTLSGQWEWMARQYFDSARPA